MQSIADYELVRPLGSGNHGQVFLALRPLRLPIATEFVAIKVLAAESNAQTYRRAIRVLRQVVAMASPDLGTLFDAGQQDGIFYYSMEYAPGGSLAAPSSTLDADHGLRALTRAARGAYALHRAGLVHGGIKPGNVLLTERDGQLVDPALAQIFTPGLAYSGAGSAAALEYADPALLTGAPLGPESDVWALGTMLHRLVSGVGIYGELPGHDGLAALRRVLSTAPEVSSSLATPVADLVRGCLRPASRRLTAEEVAARLELLIG